MEHSGQGQASAGSGPGLAEGEGRPWVSGDWVSAGPAWPELAVRVTVTTVAAHSQNLTTCGCSGAVFPPAPHSLPFTLKGAGEQGREVTFQLRAGFRPGRTAAPLCLGGRAWGKIWAQAPAACEPQGDFTLCPPSQEAPLPGWAGSPLTQLCMRAASPEGRPQGPEGHNEPGRGPEASCLPSWPRRPGVLTPRPGSSRGWSPDTTFAPFRLPFLSVPCPRVAAEAIAGAAPAPAQSPALRPAPAAGPSALPPRSPHCGSASPEG